MKGGLHDQPPPPWHERLFRRVIRHAPVTSRRLPQMWDELAKFLTSVRSITMDTDQSAFALKTILHIPDPKPDDKLARV